MPLEPDINLLPKDLIDKKISGERGVFSDEKKTPALDLPLTPSLRMGGQGEVYRAPVFSPLKTNSDQTPISDKNSFQKPALGSEIKKPPKKQAPKTDSAPKIAIMTRLKKMSFKDIANHLFSTKRESKKIDEESESVLGVELLPEEYVSVRSAMPEIIKLALIVFVFAVFYGSLLVYYGVRLKNIQSAGVELKKEIESLDAEITKAKGNETVMRDSIKVITTVNTLLASRSDWARFFNHLEELTLKRVYYTTLKTDNGESIKLIARAPTLSDALLQINVFKQQTDFIQKADIEDFKVQEEQVTIAPSEDSSIAPSSSPPASYSSSFVEFPISITLEPKWFAKE